MTELSPSTASVPGATHAALARTSVRSAVVGDLSPASQVSCRPAGLLAAAAVVSVSGAPSFASRRCAFVHGTPRRAASGRRAARGGGGRLAPGLVHVVHDEERVRLDAAGGAARLGAREPPRLHPRGRVVRDATLTPLPPETVKHRCNEVARHQKQQDSCAWPFQVLPEMAKHSTKL